MRLFNPFPVVRADLRGNRLLALVTVLLVALAVASGIAVISQERALRQGSARAADDFDLLVGAPGSPTQLVLTAVFLRPHALPLLAGDLLALVSALRGVRFAAPIAFGDNWQGHPVIGTIAEFASRGGTLAPSEGRLFRQRGEAVVGAAVKLPMAARFSPQHGPRQLDDDPASSVHATEYTVVGRLPPRHNVWDTAILVPVEDVWTLHGLPDGHAADAGEGIGPPWNPARLPGVPAIAVKPDSVAAAYALRGQLRTPRSVALFPAEVLNDLYVVLGNVRDLMSALALITQALVVAAVLMALLVGILARRREFAVLRAIGASRAYVFCVVWVEVALLISGGAALGVFTGLGVAAALSAWLRAQTGFALPVSLGAPEALLVGGLVLAGALVATLPAWLAFRRPIADGLSA
jgi:putative ABC transport system permease protein